VYHFWTASSVAIHGLTLKSSPAFFNPNTAITVLFVLCLQVYRHSDLLAHLLQLLAAAPPGEELPNFDPRYNTEAQDLADLKAARVVQEANIAQELGMQVLHQWLLTLPQLAVKPQEKQGRGQQQQADGVQGQSAVLQQQYQQQQRQRGQDQQQQQQEERLKVLEHLMLFAGLASPFAQRMYWMALKQTKAMLLLTFLEWHMRKKGQEEDGVGPQEAQIMWQALFLAIPMALKSLEEQNVTAELPRLLLADKLFSVGPREWWLKAGRDGDGSIRLVHEQQQQQLSDGACCGAAAGARAAPGGVRGESSWVEGKKPVQTVIPVCIAPAERCDWCQDLCSGTQKQQQQQQQGTAVAAGAVAYGCSLCGLARYCCERCAKAAQPCHDKNCW
jgi:hypothetical protein